MSATFLRIDIDGIDIRDQSQSHDAILREVEIRHELNEHSWCHIDLRQTSDLIPPVANWIGRSIQVFSSEQDPSGRVMFSGFVLDVKLEFEVSGSFTARLVSVSKSYKFDVAQRRAYYERKPLTAIAALMAGRTPGVEADVQSDITPTLELLQWSETDWQFLRRLCDDFARYIAVTSGGIIIQQGFPTVGPTLQWRAETKNNLLGFTIGGGLAPPSADGCHYDFEQAQSKSFFQQTEAPTFTGAVQSLITATQNQNAANLPPEYIWWRNRARTLDEYQDRVKKESRASIGKQFSCTGISQEETVAPGQKIDIQGQIAAVGKYNVFRVIHRWRISGYDNEFTCTPWQEYRASSRPARPNISGIYPARVVDIHDPERLGRIRVQFYWQEENETVLIRHLTPYAGEDRGIFFKPEVGDEVMILFEEGDPERPVIAGSAWNKADQIPNEDFWGNERDSNDIKRIVTKSGHRFSMVDKPGKEAISLATPVHSKIVLHEKTDETGRPAILLCVHDGDIILSAPEGRIHFHAKFWSREVGP